MLYGTLPGTNFRFHEHHCGPAVFPTLNQSKQVPDLGSWQTGGLPQSLCREMERPNNMNEILEIDNLG